MKTIFLVRHAKSSWDNPDLMDKERPLNKRGLRDAPFMGKLLYGKNPKIDRFISSTANRAFTTACYFADAFGLPQTDIVTDDLLYHAFHEDVLYLILKLDPSINSVVIFGHNPAWTSLANHFSDEYIANVPTCGIIQIDSTEDDWKKFNPTTAKVRNFYYPKQYFN